MLGLAALVISVTYLKIGLSNSVNKQPQKSYKAKAQSRQWCKKRCHGKMESLERISLFFYKKSKQTKLEKLSWSTLFSTEKLFGGEHKTKRHQIMSVSCMDMNLSNSIDMKHHRYEDTYTVSSCLWKLILLQKQKSLWGGQK